MPFTGPQGQGPFDDHGDCADAMEDEDGVEDADALCAVWERDAKGDVATKLRFDELDRRRLIQVAARHSELLMPGEGGGAQSLTPRQKATAATGFDVVGGPATAPRVGQKTERFDPDDPPEEVKEELEADDFVVYGKASIEQYDVEDQRISVAALEDALDRFFESQDAPGIISRGHTDVPVGMPVREHTLDEKTTLVIDGETHTFEAGETLRTEVKDADGDGLPELWLASRLANDSDIALETRYLALTGDLNGYSVTVHPKQGATVRTTEGEDVLALDLHAVTLGSDEQIKNKGSVFDVAEVKAWFGDGGSGAPGPADDAIEQVAEELGRALGRTLRDRLTTDTITHD